MDGRFVVYRREIVRQDADSLVLSTMQEFRQTAELQSAACSFFLYLLASGDGTLFVTLLLPLDVCALLAIRADEMGVSDGVVEQRRL